MWRKTGATFALLATASCADLWGFEDATGPLEGGSQDGESDARQKMDGATSPGAPVDAGAASADAHVPTSHDSGAPSHDAGATPPTCSVGCAPDNECEVAVGAGPVCVSSTATCTDSLACPPPQCCVWLSATSATGRCEQPGPAAGAGVSCLCRGQPTGPDKGACKSCETPPGYPGSTVSICK
jgi:hypothetical protein